MLRVGELPPINDYSLCNQSVTVYRFADGAVTRTYHPRAYFEFTSTQKVEKVGESGEETFLCVIPGNAKSIEVGDKVLLGEGPVVPQTDVAAWWRSFIPTKVGNLGVVRSAAARYWRGVVVHTEARG